MSTGEARAKTRGSVPLPTGTVTFLFTDIEGSTQRWESQRSAMQTAVKRHDELLHQILEAHNGCVFKTVGDAFCVAFDSVRDAVTAALEVQRAFANEDFGAVGGLRVRIALHTGNSEERDGDYFGPTVNRVARLLSVGHGGQILLSDATNVLARADLPSRSSTRDLGSHRLKDLSSPERVFQLVAPDIAGDFPPLRSLETVPNNLPFQLTSFRGREKELLEIGKLLHDTRLVTIFGAGGVGKSRLAAQAGAELLDHFADGIWRFEFASISDASLVPGVAAQALSLEESPSRPVTESIVHLLKLKRALLIFDNCEHLIDAVAQLVSAVLQGCSEVRILVTSRQGLGIAGETIYRIPSLAVPETHDELSADRAVGFGAVALFVDRAKAANSQFALTNDNAPIIAEICRRLDGIALAIELAAARVKVLSIPHLAERLNERFRILTGGDRTALRRQQTMRALIDWSYDLLSPQERTLFSRLAVFAGGWTLEAANQVCSGNGIEDIEVLDLLSSLVDKSLVVVDTSGERERFRLLESTGQYAFEKLQESGERESLARRHAHYYRDLALKVGAICDTTPWRDWLSFSALELDNFRAAMSWALGPGSDAPLAGEIAGSLRVLFYSIGLGGEGGKWAQSALARLSDQRSTIAASLVFAIAYYADGKPCYDGCMQACALFDASGDKYGAALATGLASNAAMQLGDLDEAERLNDRAIEIFQNLGETGRQMVARLANKASHRAARGDYATARTILADTLVRYPAANDVSVAPSVKSGLAAIECVNGDPATAVKIGNEVLDIDRACGRRVNVVIDLANLAVYYLLDGKTHEARGTALAGLRQSREIQHSYLAAVLLGHIAHADALEGNYERAARLIGYVDNWFSSAGQTREFPESVTYEQLMELLSERVERTALETWMGVGAKLSEDQVTDEAVKAQTTV